MSAVEILTVTAVLALVGFVLWTMPIGQRIASRLGLVGFHKQGASKEDREFLLAACGGDRDELEERLTRARAGDVGMSDAQAYRRAIRAELRTRHGGRVA